ncbi:MAG: RNA polymerase sigma factor [Ruminococcus sp.]|nr:sigma-70 family RNA polymerase sigma factor [Oscillospiraceae bacterium]
MPSTKKEIFCSEVDRFAKELYNAAFCVLKNDADSQDAVQNTLMLAYEHLNCLRNTDKLRPWLMRILLNECYKIIRQHKRNESVDIDSVEIPEIQDFHDCDDSGILRLVRSLRVNYRDVIILYYYEGMSVKEISAALDITEANVKKRLSRGRNKLRALIAGEHFP